MKKDIQIPEVEEVYIAAIREYNEAFRADEWNVYLINNNGAALETVLVVSTGYSKKQQTSRMRRKLELLPAKSIAKIEFIQDEVLALTNEFLVTYFLDNTLFEKRFIFPQHSISEKKITKLPLLSKEGILAK